MKSEMIVNSDLQKERNTCDFNIEELTNYLDGGVKNTQYRRSIEDKVFNVKGLLDEIPEEYLSHKEKYENALRKSVLYYKTMKTIEDPNLSDTDREKFYFRNLIVSSVFKDPNPFELHYSMFIEAIIGQADEKQKDYWLPRARNSEIIGTYAQTELGHGTFIRGLETTATYDPKTEEFIINSPTLTSYKWWPGGLGHTANHCIIMAQLLINGKKYGIQPFIVQIRDEETHMPLQGIKLGEIGVKQGCNSTNNGFLGFENFRIPRDRMLMKNAQVLQDGTFRASPNSKLLYGTMVFVRVTIVIGSANLLSRAITIAVRYSAVRRQSQPKPNEPEPQIIDYITQQHKLFIAIATSHAFMTTSKWLWGLYSKFTKELALGNLENLPELHALACCMKAVSTMDCTHLSEQCRLACGGHGYMLASNLPQTYALLSASSTYEGENTVLLLQTARFLVKAWDQASNNKALSPTVSYLANKSVPRKWDGSIDAIVESFQRVAAGKLKSSVSSIERYIKSGLSPEDAWNKASVQLVQASEAHCRSVILSSFKSELERTTSSLSAPLRRVLHQLFEIYAAYWALERLGDLLLYTSITENDVRELQLKYEDLLGKIRPNAVGLVDAFDYRDEILNSALGAFDGLVYERLMSEAMKSPLNAEPVNETFHKYLKPFMQGKL